MMMTDLGQQRAFFESGRTRPRAFRVAQLEALAAAIEARTDMLLEALAADLGKPPEEAYAAEIGFVLRDIRHAIRHLPRWMRDRRVRVPWIAWPGRAWVQPDPLGVVLILGPWNYPLQLLFSPLVAALAGGNCAALKPSEHAPRTAAAIQALCEAVFPPELVSVHPGDDTVAARLAAAPFDHIFFTGSTRVGRLIMAAAAERLTPLTLELGGKSPCVVCADADLALTARRILWGKCLNAGQTCVAPDYVLVQAAVHDAFLPVLAATARAFVPAGDGREPAPMARIINRRQFDRLTALAAGGEIIAEGLTDPDRLLMAPKILTRCDPHSALMQEEIFGPLLPVLPFETWADAETVIRTRPTPLAAYLFTRDRRMIRRFRRTIRAGSIGINDTITQILPADLPFGGVGGSGFGQYRGRAGFERLTHAKSVFERGTWIDPSFRYPPAVIGWRQLRRVYPWIMR